MQWAISGRSHVNWQPFKRNCTTSTSLPEAISATLIDSRECWRVCPWVETNLGSPIVLKIYYECLQGGYYFQLGHILHGRFAMSRALIACVVFSCSVAHGADSILSPSQPLSQDSTVSISQADQTRIVITKRDFGDYTTYVKREFNCADSTVRYLGNSASLNGFDPEQQDKHFSKASDTFVSSALLSEACKDTPSSLTASQ